MDGVLNCNYKKCHTNLTYEAWITSCFHVFCREHIPPGNETVRKCPFCSSDLVGQYSVYTKNLNPAEEFKSVILAGFSPSDILEMGLKAMTFLKFQTFQEKMYLSRYIKHQQLKLAQSEVQLTTTETSYKATIEKLKSLIQEETQNCENLQKDLNNYIKKTQLLENKNRYLYKVLTKYTELQRHSSQRSDRFEYPRNMVRSPLTQEDVRGNLNRNGMNSIFSPVANEGPNERYKGRFSFSQNF